jgi:y4mF family transcriptional regulator
MSMNVDISYWSTFGDMLALSTLGDRWTQSPFVDKVAPMKVNSMRDVAAAVRGRRKDLGLSQADLAARVGVSRAWINAVEAGKPSVEFDLVLRLLDDLDLRLSLAKPGSLGDVFEGRSVDLDTVLDEYRDR